MNEITIELVDRGTRWNYAKREIKIGRDPKCDLILAAEDYPMVSRNHLMIRLEGERFWVEDLNTLGGTFLNGKQIQRALLSPGDQLRLAADGPELRLFFSALSIPAKPQVAIPRTPDEDAPTRLALPDEPAQKAVTEAASAQRPAYPPPAAQSPGRMAPRSASSEDGLSGEIPRHAGALPAQEGAGKNLGDSDLSLVGTLLKRDAAIMEQKLAAMRNLLIFMTALLVIIGGMLIYQNRLIDRNRQELNDMKRDAIELLMPTLNQRLKSFDARLEKSQAAFDGIDGKIKDGEDRFMKRINQELPAMLDQELPKILNKYIDQKLREIKRSPDQQP